MKKMSLVEGEVTYTVRVATLVDKGMAQDEERVKALLERVADEQWSNSSDSEVDYDNEVPVSVDDDVAMIYENRNVSKVTWKHITERSKQIKGES